MSIRVVFLALLAATSLPIPLCAMHKGEKQEQQMYRLQTIPSRKSKFAGQNKSNRFELLKHVLIKNTSEKQGLETQAQTPNNTQENHGMTQEILVAMADIVNLVALQEGRQKPENPLLYIAHLPQQTQIMYYYAAKAMVDNKQPVAEQKQ